MVLVHGLACEMAASGEVATACYVRVGDEQPPKDDNYHWHFVDLQCDALRRNFYGMVHGRVNLDGGDAYLPFLHGSHLKQVSSPTVHPPIHAFVLDRQMQADHCRVAKRQPQQQPTQLLGVEHPIQCHQIEKDLNGGGMVGREGS